MPKISINIFDVSTGGCLERNVQLTFLVGKIDICEASLSDRFQIIFHLKTRQLSIAMQHLVFPTLDCLDFHTENSSTHSQRVFEKNVLKLYFKAMLLLYYKVSSNRKTTKQ